LPSQRVARKGGEEPHPNYCQKEIENKTTTTGGGLGKENCWENFYGGKLGSKKNRNFSTRETPKGGGMGRGWRGKTRARKLVWEIRGGRSEKKLRRGGRVICGNIHVGKSAVPT